MRLALSLILATLAATTCRAQGADARREAGKRVYDKMCAQCHGKEGQGDGVAAAFFRPAPRVFTAPTYKIRTTPSGELPTDADLKRVIRNGMPYTGMPAWPMLSDEELSGVVEYIKTFSPVFADAEAAVPPIAIPKAPRFSSESAERGRQIYEENKCADCHGQAGRGDGKSSPTLRDDWDHPIRPADMTKRWTFRGGSTRTDIYRTFTTGLNGTPMPSYADLIGEEDRWHLVDYVYSLSREAPKYATVVIAEAAEGEIALERALFEGAPPAFFSVFGQVIEPGREFYPSCNAIEVRAVYNATDVAFMLTWHDMTADTTGANGLAMPVPRQDPPKAEEARGVFSDAVAMQTPMQSVAGTVKPYFLFGDKRSPANIWFFDMARAEGELFVGRGSESIEPGSQRVAVKKTYEDGEWNVIFKLARYPESGFSFETGAFSPVAFSVWDGFNGERGNKRGVSSWYSVYLKPMETRSKAVPIAGYGALTLLVEIAVIQVVRMKSSAPPRNRR